ncbi:hypothetical protein BH23BAC3_BH23BAC3_30350 [soil metagenome]
MQNQGSRTEQSDSHEASVFSGPDPFGAKRSDNAEI